SAPAQFVDVNGTLFFTADGGSGRRWWRSDGTADGTVILADVPAGQGPGFGQTPEPAVAFHDALFFIVPLADGSFALWHSDGDGVAAGGVAVVPHQVRDLVVFDDALYFTVPSDGTLWRSDGTSAGTAVLATIGDCGIPALAPVGGMLLIVGHDAVH